MKRILFFLLVFTFSSGLFASYSFAEFLFNEGDYYRCVTELKRSLYSGETADTVKIENLLGICYLNMDKYEEADIYFKRNVDTDNASAHNHALVLFLKGDFKSASALKESEDSAANNIIYVSRLFNGEYTKQNTPELLSSESEEIFDGYLSIKNKNSFLALLMSAVLPGLGRFYTERGADAIFSITTILIPAAAAVYYKYINDYNIGFIVSAAITGVFYLGELYGAYNSAAIYKTSHIKGYYEKVVDSGFSMFSPVFEF